MPPRRRRCQPRSRKTLLDYPQLVCGRPSTAATRVNNVKSTDMASVTKVIHTDNQRHAGQFGKTAYTEWIRYSDLANVGTLSATSGDMREAGATTPILRKPSVP